MPISNRVKSLYTDMYEGGRSKRWRDLGGADKAGDVIRLWNRAGLEPGPSVIEIGCGEGAVAAALDSHHFFSRYEGFELSASGVAQCRSRGIDNASFEIIEGDRIPREDNSADVALLSHVVEHLEHPRQLIYEARRIAKYVIIEVPLELNARLPRDYVWDDLGHINKYTSTSIRQLVQTCDLVVVDQFTMNPSRAIQTFNQNTRKRVVEWYVKEYGLRVAPRLARSLFTYHEAILAAKS